MKLTRVAKATIVATAITLIASTAPAQAADLQGSGASFPAPLIEACKAAYAKSGSNSYTYASSSSGTGQANSDKSIGDFWMSDSPYTASTKRASLIHIPLVAAPIAVLINLPGTTARTQISLSAPTLAGIFSGKITKWNDPAIVADNNRSYTKVIYDTDKNGNVKKDKKGKPVILDTQNIKQTLTLPKNTIQVIYRSDSSGTTSNFTNYLWKSAPTVWTKANAKLFTDSFPGNINDEDNFGRVVGAASSNGVAQLASKTSYSITYAEVNYAATYKLKVVNLINPAGSAVAPNNDGVGAFLASSTQDANGYLTYDFKTQEKGAYPLGVVSYLLADTKYPNKGTAAAVKDFANFILSPACAGTIGDPLGFSVIDGPLLVKAKAQVAKIG